MEITRVCPMDKVSNTYEIPCTAQQLIDYENGMKLQDAFPDCNPAQREFIKTGYGADAQKALFGNAVGLNPVKEESGIIIDANPTNYDADGVDRDLSRGNHSFDNDDDLSGGEVFATGLGMNYPDDFEDDDEDPEDDDTDKDWEKRDVFFPEDDGQFGFDDDEYYM